MNRRRMKCLLNARSGGRQLSSRTDAGLASSKRCVRLAGLPSAARTAKARLTQKSLFVVWSLPVFERFSGDGRRASGGSQISIAQGSYCRDSLDVGELPRGRRGDEALAVEVCREAALQAAEKTLRVTARGVRLGARLRIETRPLSETCLRVGARSAGAVKVRRADDEGVREDEEQRERQQARGSAALSILLLTAESQSVNLNLKLLNGLVF